MLTSGSSHSVPARGFGNCKDCTLDRCCYKSWYSNGWVVIGRLTGLGVDAIGLTSSIRQVALCKQSPALSETFFQGEALGASPAEKCSCCKVILKDCRLYSAEKALLSASKQEEYSIIKDHTVYDPVVVVGIQVWEGTVIWIISSRGRVYKFSRACAELTG